MIKINSINTLYLPVYDVLVRLILLHDVVVVKLVDDEKSHRVCRKYRHTAGKTNSPNASNKCYATYTHKKS